MTAVPTVPSPAAAAPSGPAVGACGDSGGCGTAATPTVRTLIDEFLAQQSTTSAVDRFSTAHDLLDVGAPPVQAPYYRSLLPATPPGPGQQYAFEVDLDTCSGCKACVVACHSLNGLDEGESWRSVGLLVGTGDRALQQHIPTGCHHCADPGCLEGCPVDAYVKDDDGIVRHLDDQCIGCSYCTLTCPYEVPTYDSSRGIVRKCDMCHDRLAEGEAPACVRACPTQAIRISLVETESIGTTDWGFAAPSPSATKPSTVFRSTRELRHQTAGADLHTVQPRHAHPPLVVMLVLTQLAIGTFTAVEVLRSTGVLADAAAAVAATVAMVGTALALLASLAHLGRPRYAYRAVLGLRHSWLSREIVAFGVFAPLGALHAARVGGWLPGVIAAIPAWATAAAAVVVGLGAIAASSMVYAATRRSGWKLARVAPRFGLTAAALGAAATTVLAASVSIEPSSARLIAVTALALSAAGMVFDLSDLMGQADPAHARTRTARILRGPLWWLVQFRVGLGLLGLVLLFATAIAIGHDAASADASVRVLAAGGLITTLLGEAGARWWFFAAEGSLRMPGVPS